MPSQKAAQHTDRMRIFEANSVLTEVHLDTANVPTRNATQNLLNTLRVHKLEFT